MQNNASLMFKMNSFILHSHFFFHNMITYLLIFNKNNKMRPLKENLKTTIYLLVDKLRLRLKKIHNIIYLLTRVFIRFMFLFLHQRHIQKNNQMIILILE